MSRAGSLLCPALPTLNPCCLRSNLVTPHSLVVLWPLSHLHHHETRTHSSSSALHLTISWMAMISSHILTVLSAFFIKHHHFGGSRGAHHVRPYPFVVNAIACWLYHCTAPGMSGQWRSLSQPNKPSASSTTEPNCCIHSEPGVYVQVMLSLLGNTSTDQATTTNQPSLSGLSLLPLVVVISTLLQFLRT